MNARSLLFCFLLGAAAAAASESRPGLVSFRRIAIPEDVPAHLCSALAQDGQGFLWIGTQGGLVRFDGYRFRTWTSDPAKPATIGGSYVRALLAARDGTIWIGFFSGGLSSLDPATGRITRYAADRVEGLAEDAKGRIWIATNDGLARLDPRGGRIEMITHEQTRGLLIDRRGNVWSGTRAGLQRNLEQVALDGEYVTKIYEDARGRIWIGTAEHGAAVLDPASGALRRFLPGELSHFWVYGFAETGNEVWIATFGGGIDVVDGDSLQIVDRLRHDATLDTTIPADRVGAILRDRSGVVWAGTWGEGLARHDPSTRAFRALRFSPAIRDGLTHPSAVRALETSDGRIWVGTNGNGIDILDGELRRVNHIGDLADGAVTCLAQASNHDVWVATLDGTLQRMSTGTRFTKDDGLPGGPIRTIAFTTDGAVWAGSAFGMARIDPASDRVTAFVHDPNDRATLSAMAIESIAIAPDGTLWVGTEHGLNRFDPATGRAQRIEKGLPDNWVPDLTFDRKGRLWVGTHGGAAILRSFDGTTARFDNVAAELHRAPSPAEELVEDASGKMWIGPHLRVDADRWTAEAFGPADGSTFVNIFIASRAATRDGRLLFGSPQGLLVVDPAAIRPWTYAPQVVATSGVSALRLAPGNRAFRLEFAALDLTAPERIAYRYKLEGYDRAWTAADASQRSLVYASLPAGDYTLRVAATNRAGVWSPRELRIPVSVPAAFYETVPFRALLTIAAAALIYLVYRLRVRRLRARGEALERIVAARTEELRVAYARIEEASLTDALTGLRNRRYLEQTIGPDLALAARAEGDDLIFLLVDLDHFKSVNDTYGHDAGDAVLVQIAAILRAFFRTSDAVVRWGGEELLVVVRFVGRAHADELAEKLRHAVESHQFALPDGRTIERTCSIGAASWPFSRNAPDALTWQEILGIADAALYLVKESGRNGWMHVEAPANCMAPRDAAAHFRDDPRAAIERGEVIASARPAAPSART
jgi:diguanylate cyclase (GGDEF)-like protein